MSQSVRVALAGNPNAGKTTIFNNLTGARQQVANYPGVTVEKKTGRVRHGELHLEVVDLPGIYSLTAFSEEELIARHYVMHEMPDVVVDVVDVSNLERNLYLAVQLMELNVPLILVFNMSDVAESRGVKYDTSLLEELLGVPVVTTVGHRKEGMEELLQTIDDVVHKRIQKTPVPVHYGRDLDREIETIEQILEGSPLFSKRSHWYAIKLMERDQEVWNLLEDEEIRLQVEKSIEHIESLMGDHVEVLFADHRYGFISGACQEATLSTAETRHTHSDKIDAVITSRFLGMPIFLFMMYLVFYMTFKLGDVPMQWLEMLFAWTGDLVSGFWAEGVHSPLRDLLVEGVLGGVGGVVVFLPNIVFLFLAISILEDSGYMARAAFIMDNLMHKIGLHGKSFIPMVIGFGCSVPAILATRTLENKRGRLTTMLVIPLISCGARFPIYALLIPAFFPQEWHARILWLIYLIGVVLAIAGAKLLRVTVFKGETEHLVMELPPYRVPTLTGLLIHTWERAWMYLKKAGTVILGLSVLLWVLSSYPAPDLADTEVDSGTFSRIELERSFLGQMGKAIEPVVKPLGFDWKIGTALIGSFAAKEVFVAQLGVVYAVGDADENSGPLADKLKAAYTPLVGFCIMLFCLISTPCIATIAATRQESGSWKWAIFQLIGLTVLAYAVTWIVYTLGSMFEIGVTL